ncbi:hypothetical protein ACN42_g9552 [Penicillium freii]|uniref:Uncharacterized protein n=1 Tax=Penicillium freii TaxID=48697 RepID=A0A117NLG2_PENFR|nr:hypothetical protein ACN42_g9552 [Penicillium freii]
MEGSTEVPTPGRNAGLHIPICQSARLNTWILHGIIPCRSHDFEYSAYHVLLLVIITAQIVEIAGFCHLC